jgi:hypothetical protein
MDSTVANDEYSAIAVIDKTVDSVKSAVFSATLVKG